jgi:hypothetical protein
MDLKTLLPDFNAIGKTDWSKPQLDTKDKTNLLMFVGAALMVVFVFLSWIKLTATYDLGYFNANANAEGERGQNAAIGDLDLRQSSERGADNAQGNSDEPAGEVASEGGIKFRKVTNPFKVA